MKRTLSALAILACVSAPAAADVTITSNTSGKGLGAMAGGPSTLFIKGTRMRTDQTVRGETLTTIMDAQTGQMISFSSNKKEAEVYNLAQMSAEMSKSVSLEGLKVQMTPNGQTKELLGRPATGYTLNISLPMKMGEMQMDMTMGGPVWIVKGAPGTADYAAFYKAAAEKGLFFGNPQQAKAQPAQAKGMAEMYRAMAQAGGVPYETAIEIRFAGEGPMAAMMSKMGGMGITTTVTAISTDPIGDDKFAPPAGYTLRNR
jgi:hypothetical protein